MATVDVKLEGISHIMTRLRKIHTIVLSTGNTERVNELRFPELRRRQKINKWDMYGLQRDKLEVINHAAKTSCYMMKEAVVIPQTLPERQR